MTYAPELIMLASTKVGEKNLVLHTLSAEWGRRSFICSLSGSSRMSLFQPLNILDAEVTENSRSDLWRARKFCATHQLNSLRSNLHKNTMALFISEVLYRTIKDDTSEDGLFEWCKKCILTLDALESDFSNYHLRFLLELAGILGFSPSEEDILPFAGKHLKEISLLLKSGFAESMLIPLNGESRNEIAGILLQYLGCHTESAINVRSLTVLREIFK